MRSRSTAPATGSEPLRFAAFETAIGAMGIAWTPSAVAMVQLPEKDAAATLARLRARLSSAGEPAEITTAPTWLRRAVAAIQRHLAGKAQELSTVPLALDGIAAFRRRVYEAARRVKSGRTVTYGELSELAGSPGASRAVGSAMATNPFPMLVPCHRVVASGGKPGGFTARGGVATKARILQIEGVGSRTTAVASGSTRKAAVVSSAGFTGAPGKPRTPRGATSKAKGSNPHAKAVRFLTAADPKLGAMMARIGPCRLERRSVESPFETLLEAIVHQQLTGKAAQTILARVKLLFPGGMPTPKKLAALPDMRLRAAGLSGSKTASLKDLAARALAGEIPDLAELERLGDEEIIERLSAVRGIGRWTVEMLLLFNLGRPDVLPATDYGIRKGFARTFTSAAARRRAAAAGEDVPLPPPAELLAYGERWRPHRSVASWYLWRCLELPD